MVEGIAAITQRIAQIQTTIASLSAPAAQPAATSGSAFTSALDDALAEFEAPPLTSALNAAGVPTELAAYGNGHIPREALDPVGDTGHRLWAPAADSLERLLASAEAAGVTIGITDSYRPYDVQVDVVRRKGLYSEGGLGAAPGTSPHGWGMAVDLDLDPDAQAWMRANAGRFGFVEDTPREPWHWAYEPTA
ncbi:D-alanyl-D-alanine carboxypeptidase family protein [Georgenia sp. AZ-5]|uniref:M15 family metallopeptidase n=1 Tax=Georgenia sp. AZ-5 TaxID=3367526 RepID=UPI00375414E6